MATIDQAEFETLKEQLAGAYEALGTANLPYANVHLVLNRLGLEDIASPYTGYLAACQQYQAAAQRILETKTVDELRAFLLEPPKTAESAEESEPVEPR